ncbi:MAG: hypothetical protein KDA35_00770, partial [Hyphomonadaceae bacterium]|nr:hypothetical protein [Hyphomonadaceae bacterium]
MSDSLDEQRLAQAFAALRKRMQHPARAERMRASEDERLITCVAAWLAQYHDLIDGRRLSELTRAATPRTRAYVGALLSLAIEAPEGAGRAPQFDTALSHCEPLRRSRAFYDVAERLPAHRRWMREHSKPVYRRWR